MRSPEWSSVIQYPIDYKSHNARSSWCLNGLSLAMMSTRPFYFSISPFVYRNKWSSEYSASHLMAITNFLCFQKHPRSRFAVGNMFWESSSLSSLMKLGSSRCYQESWLRSFYWGQVESSYVFQALSEASAGHFSFWFHGLSCHRRQTYPSCCLVEPSFWKS